jgi:hypothetical protein
MRQVVLLAIESVSSWKGLEFVVVRHGHQHAPSCVMRASAHQPSSWMDFHPAQRVILQSFSIRSTFIEIPVRRPDFTALTLKVKEQLCIFYVKEVV